MSTKAWAIAALLLLLMFAILWVKLAILRTTIMMGGSMFMVGVLALVVALAVVMFAMRSRRARI